MCDLLMKQLSHCVTLSLHVIWERDNWNLLQLVEISQCCTWIFFFLWTHAESAWSHCECIGCYVETDLHDHRAFDRQIDSDCGTGCRAVLALECELFPQISHTASRTQLGKDKQGNIHAIHWGPLRLASIVDGLDSPLIFIIPHPSQILCWGFNAGLCQISWSTDLIIHWSQNIVTHLITDYFQHIRQLFSLHINFLRDAYVSTTVIYK